MNDEKLEEALGPVDFLNYQNKATELERQAVQRLVAMLPTLSDEALVEMCVTTSTEVLLSESRRATAQEPYLKNRACMQEAQRRHEAAGHVPKCLADNLYTEATNRTSRNFGFEPSEPNSCTCKVWP